MPNEMSLLFIESQHPIRHEQDVFERFPIAPCCHLFRHLSLSLLYLSIALVKRILEMAYKGQKVQKVMVQPIVSFLIIVKGLFFTLQTVQMASHRSTCLV